MSDGSQRVPKAAVAPVKYGFDCNMVGEIPKVAASMAQIGPCAKTWNRWRDQARAAMGASGTKTTE